MSDALIAIFSNGDVRGPIMESLNQTLSFSYQGSPFGVADLLFAAEADSFTMNTVSYVPVPEPMSFMMLASGLLGLAVLRRRT